MPCYTIEKSKVEFLAKLPMRICLRWGFASSGSRSRRHQKGCISRKLAAQGLMPARADSYKWTSVGTRAN